MSHSLRRTFALDTAPPLMHPAGREERERKKRSPRKNTLGLGRERGKEGVFVQENRPRGGFLFFPSC